MNEQAGSKTAFGAASLRAAHQLLDGEPKLLNDPVILSLLGEEARQNILKNKERFFHTYAVSMRTNIVLRSRYTEDCLKTAYEKGIRQYILLGAGLDTFAYRQPAWAKDLKIIESDHPSSRQTKLSLLKNADIPAPDNVTYEQVDFERDILTQVFDDVIDMQEPVFISCLGVLVYLTKHTCKKIFRFAGSLPKGSEFVFTAKQNADDNIIAQRAAEAGEPWITHFTKEELADTLYNCGFSYIHFLTAGEIKELYSGAAIIQSFPPQRSSIVKAVI